MICATFVKLSADPVQADPRSTGRIEHLPVGDLELSSVVAGSQHVRRTRSLIAHSNDEYLLTRIQLSGRGRVPFHHLVVQDPKRELPLRDTRTLTARTLGRRGPGEVVPAFFTALARAAKDSPELDRLLGDGVAAELRRMRIEHAKALLLAEPLRPVGAVGRACGFDSESGFHRAFRSATGVTPGAYRQLGQVGTSGQ